MKIQTIAVRGGLSSYLSLLDDSFTYVPSDVIVPGILEVGDISDVLAALEPRATLLGSMVDGRDRRIPGKGDPIDIGRWIVARSVGPR